MKLSLFAKAVKLQKYLKETGSCRNKLYFEYDFGDTEKNIPVELEIQDNCTIIKCRCKHHSLNWLSLCSYSLGAVYYLLKKAEGKK